jgi:hypothetical protein
VKLLLVVSANSLDSVERIRQTPSDESVSRIFAEAVGSMIGAEKRVYGERSATESLMRSYVSGPRLGATRLEIARKIPSIHRFPALLGFQNPSHFLRCTISVLLVVRL